MKEIEKIIEIENKYNLFEKSIMGIFFWKLVRLEVYESIMLNKGLYNKAQNNINFKLYNLLSKAPQIFTNVFKRSWSLNHSQKDILIFRHPRKVLVNDQYIDIYTKYIEDEMKLSNRSYESIDFPDNLIHRTKYDESVSNIESVSLAFDYLYGILQKKFFISKKLTNSDLQYIKQLNEVINEDFDININLLDIVVRSIAKFKYRKRYFTRILRKKNPSIIYLVVHYSRHELIAAANEMGIKVIEIQHGIITPFHIGYSYSTNFKIPYFPDSMVLYGSIWSEIVDIPLPTNNLFLRKFDYLYEQKKNLMSIEKENTITIISQGTIFRELFEFSITLAKLMENYKIYYKLHPGEIVIWNNHKSKYELPKNLVVVSTDFTIYELFSISKYVIGVYSTAVYEALYFECKILILNLSGYKYLEDLLKNGYANLIESADQAEKIIREDITAIKKVHYDTIFGGL